MADEKLVDWQEKLIEANERNDVARVLELKGWINARLALLTEEKRAKGE